MIPFDFAYYRPETVEEGIQVHADLASQGKNPMYYGGGTEFISMARLGNVYTEAVIDLKGIPELNRQEITNGELSVGAAVSLTSIAEQNLFPLLSMTVRRIADHTIQGKITLGGNLAGTIIYREAVLPFLVTDSEVELAGPQGRRRVSLKDVFDKRLLPAAGEMLVRVVTKEPFLSLPYVHAKRTKNEKIDYPLITLVGIRANGKVNLAFSGLCEYPVRPASLEDIINQQAQQAPARVDEAIAQVADLIICNTSGSRQYREFVLRGMLLAALAKLEAVN